MPVHFVSQILQVVPRVALCSCQCGQGAAAGDKLRRFQRLDSSKSVQPSGAVRDFHYTEHAAKLDNIARENGPISRQAHETILGGMGRARMVDLNLPPTHFKDVVCLESDCGIGRLGAPRDLSPPVETAS